MDKVNLKELCRHLIDLHNIIFWEILCTHRKLKMFQVNLAIVQFATKMMKIVMEDQKQQLQNQLKHPLKNHQIFQVLFADMWNAKEIMNIILKVIADSVFVYATMVLQVKFAVALVGFLILSQTAATGPIMSLDVENNQIQK